MILLDTNILIELFKKTPKYLLIVKNIGVNNLIISKMSVFEMYIGALNKKEINDIRKFLDYFSQIPIDETITDSAIDLVYQYRLSHSLYIGDAIIAATALKHKIPLYTLNIKDFKYIPDLKLYAAI